MIKSQELPMDRHPQGAAALEVLSMLQHRGHRALVVGGAVRDWLRGEEPEDLDLVTSASPEEIEAIFPRTVPVGKAFGVIRVLMTDCEFEVASFRADGQSTDGRHPDFVRPGTQEEDAVRRDFTVNGIYYDPHRKEIIDLVGGLQDLSDRRLRTIGDPALRFQEDHLRILRAYRFSSQLGFDFDDLMIKQIRSCSNWVQGLSAERIFVEIKKIMAGTHRTKVLPLMVDHGVLWALFPSIQWRMAAWSPWKTRATMAPLFEWGRWILKCDGDPLVNLKSLKASRVEIESTERALRWWRPDPTQELGEWVDALFDPVAEVGAREFIATGGNGTVKEALKLRENWGGGKPAPWVKAADVPEFQGAQLGRLLKRAWYLQVTGSLKSKEEVLSCLRLEESQKPAEES